jgi:hypothetical protein
LTRFGSDDDRYHPLKVFTRRILGTASNLAKRYAPYAVVGSVLGGLLVTSFSGTGGIWPNPFLIVAYSHGLLIDLILSSLSIPSGGTIELVLLVTYVVVGFPAVVASEKIRPPASSSARWLRALIVWLMVFAGLTVITVALGWLGILRV